MYKEVTLDEQKRIQLEMLLFIRDICKEYSINYFLGGGTLLGAIRHKGYIPWDDDIDIMLPREDYDRLIEIFKNLTNNKYKVMDFKCCKDYYYNFAKIIDTRTILIENNFRKIEGMGIYIDVFPIDEIPDQEEKRKKIFNKYRFYNTFLSICQKNNKEDKTSNVVKKYIKKIIRYFIWKFNLNIPILKRVDKISRKYKNTNTVACISGRYVEKEIMPKSYIRDYILVDFEGEKFKAPIGYNDYLKKHYGDYMKLPPKNQQIANHDNIAYWKNTKKDFFENNEIEK